MWGIKNSNSTPFQSCDIIPSALFPSAFPPQIVCALVNSPECYISHQSHSPGYDHTITFDKEWNHEVSQCSLLHPPVTSSLLVPITLPSTVRGPLSLRCYSLFSVSEERLVGWKCLSVCPFVSPSTFWCKRVNSHSWNPFFLNSGSHSRSHCLDPSYSYCATIGPMIRL